MGGLDGPGLVPALSDPVGAENVIRPTDLGFRGAALIARPALRPPDRAVPVGV